MIARLLLTFVVLTMGGCCSSDLRGAAVELRGAVDDIAATSMPRPGVDPAAWDDIVSAAKDAAAAVEERTR